MTLIKRSLTLALIVQLVMITPVAARSRYIDLTKPTPGTCAVRSLILPGSGKYHLGRKKSGYAITASIVALGCTALWLDRDADRLYREYKKLGVQDDTAYDDYEVRVTQGQITVIALAGVWMFGVWDAYVQSQKQERTKTQAHVPVIIGRAG